MGKLSRKDAKVLSLLATTPELQDKLNEYIDAEKVVSELWKEFREAVVNGEGVKAKSPNELRAEVEVDKAVKPVETKRKFKAGDKVRVTSVEKDVAAMTGLSVGDVTEVIAHKDDSPKDWWFIRRRPVIVTGGRGHRGYFEESALELVEEKSPNELRAEVIQRAKDFVSKNSNGNHLIVEGIALIRFTGDAFTDVLNFVVNSKKRTVVASIKGKRTGTLYARGIAKCYQDDVFNEHIGKAIALGRALGKDVSEFENTVQPSEPVIGHKLSNQYLADIDEITSFVGYRMCVNGKLEEYWLKETLKTGVTKIIDDTDAIYEEEVE